MPTYRYRCGQCGDELEVWQSFTEDSLTEHEACGGELRKVLSPAGIVLKGSGFYRNDSRSGNGHGSRDAKDRDSKDSGSRDKDSKESKGQSSKDKSGSGSDSSSSTSDAKPSDKGSSPSTSKT